jgi:lysyl-tRNA synthetase class 2
VSRLGRIVRVDQGALSISVLGRVFVRPCVAGPFAVGDLVHVDDDAVTLAARNTSQTPIEQQDWWRLHRIASNLAERARIERDVRGWFSTEGFLDVTTPHLAPCPGLEVQLRPIAAAPTVGARYLMTSPEYHMKRLLSAGFDRLVYFGRAFRDDERGRHHHIEFTMLEWYRAGGTPDDVMADVERLVALATGRARTWTRLTVHEALARFSTPSSDPDVIIRALVEDVEPQLASLGAVFLTEWPRELASLARLCPHDPTVSERFEAYLDGVELANGFGELTDPAEQRERFHKDLAERAALGLPLYPLDERFLDALAAGLPRCTGIALGLDRLIMAALGAPSLDDVVPFPPELA